jgi:alpha/beta superfamily hydrolase
MLESAIDDPPGTDHAGVAVVCHPHPLHGGTMENKVVSTLARAFVRCGWRAVRFNFRGVGQSAGVYDDGVGETQDLLAVIEQTAGRGPLALAGFSFGTFVLSRGLTTLWPGRDIEKLVLVGTAVARLDVAQIPAALHERTLVVHGENDETVTLADVLAWARPQHLPVTVLPAASHFFHGQLPLLRGVVERHLSAKLTS